MTTRKARLAFTIKRLKGFAQTFRRSKRGMLGVLILLIAGLVAIGAPWLTPHHPINTTSLAGNTAAPSWYRYFPGGEDLSENFYPIKDSDFSSMEVLKELNISITPTVQNVFIQHSTDVGYPGSPGSLAIIYERAIDTLPVNSTIKIVISKEFYYPYSGIPGRMTLGSSLLLARIDGISVQAKLFLMQKWPSNVREDLFQYNVTTWNFGAVDVRLFPRGKPEVYTEENFTITRRVLDWISPSSPPIYDAQAAYVTLKQLFPKAGDYVYGMELTIRKLEPAAEAVIYVDKMNIRLFGTAFGIMGTDNVGRDIFTQLVYGTRISLIVGLLATFLSVFIGLIVGLVAAYMGGIVDEALMRFTDALLVLPGLPLIIVLMAVLFQSQYNMTALIVVIGFLGWMGFARVVRSQVLTLKERPYVEAAKAVGAGTPYILSRHILPNVISLIYVTLALSVPGAIVSEAALSFLGFIDVANMSWGRMLQVAQGRPELWWWVIPPGLAIAILSLSFILLGYALDEILNPKLRMRR